MQLDPKAVKAAEIAAFKVRTGEIEGDELTVYLQAYLEAAPSPSPAPGVVGALTAAKDFIALEYADARAEQYGEWLAPEARKVFGLICETLASLSQPAKGEREAMDDASLAARLKEIAVEVFPSANKFAVADGVKNIIRILERIEPAEYAVLHRSMYPFSRSAPTEDDGQPNEAQEWHDYDPDC